MAKATAACTCCECGKSFTASKILASRGQANNLSGARFSTILPLYRVLGADVFIAAGMTEEEIRRKSL